MAKRLMMVALFVGALGLMSLAVPSTAEARGGCYRGHHYSGFYGPPVHTRSFYRGSYYAHPRSLYRASPRYYGGSGFHYGGHRYGGHRGGLYIRF